MLTIRIALAMFSLAISTTDAASSIGSIPRPAASRSTGSIEGRVESHAPAEEVVGVEASEQEVRVRHRHLAAAAAVADRTGLRPGAARADAKEAARVDPRDRAAAGTDRLDVDQRDRRRQSPLDLVLRRVALLAADDDADVGARAADVERDHVLLAQRSATHSLAIMPPAGPDITVWIGWSAAASASIAPPFDFIIVQGRVMPVRRSAPSRLQT